MTDPAKPALLAYDGSDSAATAIAVAGQLLPGRPAVVCHVPHGDDRTADEVVANGVQLARTAGLDARPMVEREQRKVWRALLAAANRRGASLIAVGAQGLSGVRRAILGSVSAALVHRSPIPVLVAPRTSADATDGPLLLCYDGSEGARHAIAVAGREFGRHKALVLHSWESWVVETPALAGASTTVQGVIAELDEIADEQSAQHTAEGLEVAEQAGFDAEGLSERATGPTLWNAILDIADQHGCAAIVLGPRGLTGVSAALGSVSNGVIHHSRRPVLVVPPAEEP